MFASRFLKREINETLSILFERFQSSPQMGYGFYMYVRLFVVVFFLAMLHSKRGLSSLTKDGTHAPFIGSAKS